MTGLQIYYNMQGNGNDVSGNGNNATTANVLFSLANGKILEGGGFTNSPKSTWIKTGTTLPASGSYAFSVSFWVKVSSPNNYPYVFSISSTTDSAGVPNPTDSFIGAFYDPSGNLISYGLSFGTIGFINDGLYHHVVITSTGSTLTRYFNGNFVSSSGVSPSVISPFFVDTWLNFV